MRLMIYFVRPKIFKYKQLRFIEKNKNNSVKNNNQLSYKTTVEKNHNAGLNLTSLLNFSIFIIGKFN